MVWYGMVWYGMVWYGMVWYGMVWYGMALVWYDKPYSKTLASARQQFVRFHEGRRTIEVFYKKTIYRNYVRDKKMCRN